jgi:hypothetical protein
MPDKPTGGNAGVSSDLGLEPQNNVVPAEAGTHRTFNEASDADLSQNLIREDDLSDFVINLDSGTGLWVPACAGMTVRGGSNHPNQPDNKFFRNIPIPPCAGRNTV